MTNARTATDADDHGVNELDARLAVGAVAAWLVLLPAVSSAAAAVFAGACAAALLGLTAVAVAVRSGSDSHRHFGPGRRPVRRVRVIASGLASTIALSALCIVIVLLCLSAKLTRAQSGPVHDMAAARAAGVFEATVVSDPRALGGASFGASRVAVDARLSRLRSGTTAFRVNVPVVLVGTGPDWARLGPGQHVRLDGRMAPDTDSELIAAIVSARGSPVPLGRPSALQRLADRVRAGLRTACAGLPQPERGLLPGLVDGDTSALDPALKQQFKVAGLTHLVAVSGTNAAIVVGVLLLVLRRARVPPWLSAVLGAVCLVLFVEIARPSPSVLRAAVMAAILLLSLASGRPRQGLPTLAFAVLVLLSWHPDWARNAGFAMSVLATGALLVVAPAWAAALRRRHVPPFVAEGLAVSAAATAISAPVIVLVSGQISLVSLPANLLAETAVAPATVLGVLAAVTAPWCPQLGTACAYLASFPCRWLVGVATCFGSLSGATVAWPQSVSGALLLCILIVVVVALVRLRRLRALLLAAALTALIVQIPVRSATSGWPAPGTIFVVCDVGQGDAVVLPIGRHSAVVMDAGPEPVATDRCLKALGITTVAVYIQSHYHLDHVGGIDGLIRGRQVGRVYVGPLTTPAQGREILDHALSRLGIKSTVVAVNTVIDAGPVHLQVLASHVITVDSVGDPNESSLVVRATVRGRTILLTGDASIQAQQDLMASGEPISADVLKVPHHGSAYFSPGFMAAVHARLGIVSVGAHNPYGHPALRLLDDLSGLGMSVRRTDQDGDVAVVATSEGIGVALHRSSVTAAGATGAAPPATQSLSVRRATMGAWPTARAISPAHSIPSAARYWSSGTRSFSSAGPSSRSPPRGVAPIQRRRRLIDLVRKSRLLSSTNC